MCLVSPLSPFPFSARVIYARLSPVPHQGCAISSLSVTCKVDALWAARKTRHRNLISLSARCLQAPRGSSLRPSPSDSGSSRETQAGSLATSAGIYHRDGGGRGGVQASRPAPLPTPCAPWWSMVAGRSACDTLVRPLCGGLARELALPGSCL